MIIDRFNLFADNVTPTFTVSTNQLLGVSVDLGEYLGEVDNVGVGHPYYLAIFVTTAFASAGAATMEFALKTDDNVNMTTPTFLVETKTFSAADLGNLGRLFVTTLPSGFEPYQRYIGLFNINNNVVFTAGGISAFITRDVQDWNAYPQGKVTP